MWRVCQHHRVHYTDVVWEHVVSHLLFMVDVSECHQRALDSVLTLYSVCQRRLDLVHLHCSKRNDIGHCSVFSTIKSPRVPKKAAFRCSSIESPMYSNFLGLSFSSSASLDSCTPSVGIYHSCIYTKKTYRSLMATRRKTRR